MPGKINWRGGVIVAEDGSESDYLFGPLPGSFFELLGQTIAAAGLVELKLYELVTSLDHVQQHVHAGEFMGKMIKRCRTLLRSGQFRPEFVAQVEGALIDVEDEMERRNEVVHNVWTFTRDGRIFGWRPAPVGKRDAPEPSMPGVEVAPYGFASRDWTEPDLRSLFDALAHLQDRLTRLRDECEWSRITTS